MQRRRNIYLLGQATSGKGKGERCVGGGSGQASRRQDNSTTAAAAVCMYLGRFGRNREKQGPTGILNKVDRKRKREFRKIKDPGNLEKEMRSSRSSRRRGGWKKRDANLTAKIPSP